ncbi:peptidoglycan bridge formation glycyltransferase FemA/FemB family protein [Kineosporia sp. A_224]|uniref:lipid II:glycine glycyltransferase FemX n=1 Tax=Kineosporia sp. A_224 TaxID=1962180 RepID=UPI00130447F4|nr:peptidoglycan bridge formation glycyltransferase FemA/FemB family protein [Kineosporia sp. A_224]
MSGFDQRQSTQHPPHHVAGGALRLIPIDDEALRAFVDLVGGSALQTPEWAAVKPGWEAERLGWADDGGRLVAAALVLHRRLPLGPARLTPRRTLAYVPEGPVMLPAPQAPDPGAVLTSLVRHVRAEGAFTLRVGPRVRHRVWDAARVRAAIAAGAADLDAVPPARTDPEGARWTAALDRLGWTAAPRDLGDGQPWLVAVLDVADRSAADLRAGTNQQWRRNLARAQAAGVEVRRATPTDVAVFEDLYVETARRHGFVPRPRGYLTRLLGALGGRARLDVAVHEGAVLAGAVTVRTGPRVCYLYGASTARDREVRAANALHWSIALRVAEQGGSLYDLRGVEPGLRPSDPASGLLRFKAGLGADAVEYVGEWELGLRPGWAAAYRVVRERQRRRAAAR